MFETPIIVMVICLSDCSALKMSGGGGFRSYRNLRRVGGHMGLGGCSAGGGGVLNIVVGGRNAHRDIG